MTIDKFLAPDINTSRNKLIQVQSKFPRYKIGSIGDIAYCLIDNEKISCLTTPKLFKHSQLDRTIEGKLLPTPFNQERFILRAGKLKYQIGNQQYLKDKIDRALKLLQQDQLKIYYHDTISYNLILLDNSYVFLIAPSNKQDKEGNLIFSDNPYPEVVFCSKIFKRLMKCKNNTLIKLIKAIHEKYLFFDRPLDIKRKPKLELLELLIEEIQFRPRNRKHYKEMLSLYAELIALRELQKERMLSPPQQ